MSNIKNPSAAKIITNFEVETFNSSTLLDSTSTATIAYSPITLPASDGSLVSANPTVGVYAALTVTLKIGTALTSGSQVIITFPKWEQSSLGQSSPGSMIDSVTAVTSTGENPTFTTSIST